MKKTRIQKQISILLLLVMSLNLLFSTGISYADTVENLLTDLKLEITQNDSNISEGGNLEIGKPISVKVSFSVPVLGDYPSPETPVKKGDSVLLQLSDSFSLLSNNSSVALVDETSGVTVGHVTFSTDSETGMVSAMVSFDGDDSVFSGDYNTVHCRFSLDMQYNSGNSGNGSSEELVTILGKTFVVIPPASTIQYQLVKNATVDMDNKKICWHVAVSAASDGNAIDLHRYTFFDDLTNVGTFVAGSFQVDGALATPIVDGNILKYTFPAGSVSPKTVTFETEIPDAKLYVNAGQSISNKAQLLDSTEKNVAEGGKTVAFTPVWIKKEGVATENGSSGSYDPNNRTITWTITANQMEIAMDHAIITDVLKQGLLFQSATLQKWNGSAWDAAEPITPNSNGEFALHNISTKILLTIIAGVPDENVTTGTITYSNNASIRWDGQDTKIDSGNVSVSIGFNSITKRGVAATDQGTVTWTVNVDAKNQNIPNMKVFDLLVYADKNSGFNLLSATGFPSGLLSTDLTPSYSQKYVPDSFRHATLSIAVHPILQGGIRVADLLEITGFTPDTAFSYTFDSQILSPDIYAGNENATVTNNATLFSAFTKLNNAKANVTYKSKILAKGLLNADAISDPAAHVNDAATTDADSGFDYTEKAAVFRLEVNANKMDLSNALNARGDLLGKITVTDALPAGWEFLEIAPGQKYLIFEGAAQPNGSIHAVDTTPDDVPGLSAIFSGNTATFTFDNLSKSYVILVKAAPTSETALEYFSKNGSYVIRNHLTLSAENWSASKTVYQDINLISKILKKSLEVPRNGMLLWTVDYCPYGLPVPGNKLVDTLPQGIDLRTDASGKLLIDGNITANELPALANGDSSLGAAVTLVQNENLLYDSETKELTFLLPDNQKAYRFTYVTDITGETGTVTNHVALYSQSNEMEGTEKSYSITAADGIASLKQNGWISITKTNENNTLLPGAQFTLFALDNETVIRSGTTAEDGILTLKSIPAGNYILRETAAPEGYTPDSTSHTVTVSNKGTSVFTAVDNQTGSNANLITVLNEKAVKFGDLTIRKTVAGNAADSQKAFQFTIVFDAAGSYRYTGNGVPDGNIQSGDTISLAHGQSITILNLPENTTYTAKETDYSAEGYVTASTGETGTISADAASTATFINTKSDGPTCNLTVSKKVAGNTADRQKAFQFTIVFDAAGSYSYIGTGVPDGSIQSGDTVSLAHGQSITVLALPANTAYSVKEKDYTAEGYVTASTGSAGTISANVTAAAAFINTKDTKKKDVQTGQLTIEKTVSGSGGDSSKKFNFKVIFSGAADAYHYTGAANETIRSGDTISLAHNESITITGLPAGTKYEIQEADYSSLGYTATAKNAQGLITANTTRTASFTNKYTASTVRTANTGDSNTIGMQILKWIFAAGVLLLAAGGILISRKKRNHE